MEKNIALTLKNVVTTVVYIIKIHMKYGVRYTMNVETNVIAVKMVSKDVNVNQEP